MMLRSAYQRYSSGGAVTARDSQNRDYTANTGTASSVAEEAWPDAYDNLGQLFEDNASPGPEERSIPARHEALNLNHAEMTQPSHTWGQGQFGTMPWQGQNALQSMEGLPHADFCHFGQEEIQRAWVIVGDKITPAQGNGWLGRTSQKAQSFGVLGQLAGSVATKGQEAKRYVWGVVRGARRWWVLPVMPTRPSASFMVRSPVGGPLVRAAFKQVSLTLKERPALLALMAVGSAGVTWAMARYLISGGVVYLALTPQIIINQYGPVEGHQSDNPNGNTSAAAAGPQQTSGDTPRIGADSESSVGAPAEGGASGGALPVSRRCMVCDERCTVWVDLACGHGVICQPCCTGPAVQQRGASICRLCDGSTNYGGPRRMSCPVVTAVPSAPAPMKM